METNALASSEQLCIAKSVIFPLCNGTHKYLRKGETGTNLRLAVEASITPAGFTIKHISLAFIHAFWTAAMVLQAIF